MYGRSDMITRGVEEGGYAPLSRRRTTQCINGGSLRVGPSGFLHGDDIVAWAGAHPITVTAGKRRSFLVRLFLGIGRVDATNRILALAQTPSPGP